MGQMHVRGGPLGPPRYVCLGQAERSYWHWVMTPLKAGGQRGRDLVARDDAALGVAVRVEGERADDGGEATRAHDGLEDFVAVVGAGLRERSEDDLRGGVAIRGVERRLAAVMGGLVLVGPHLAGPGSWLVSTPPKVRYVPLRGRAGAVVPGLLVDAVRAEHLDSRVADTMSFQSLPVPWPVIAPTKTTSAPEALIFWASAA